MRDNSPPRILTLSFGPLLPKVCLAVLVQWMIGWLVIIFNKEIVLWKKEHFRHSCLEKQTYKFANDYTENCSKNAYLFAALLGDLCGHVRMSQMDSDN